MTAKKIVVVGPPHPLTRAMFQYFQALGSEHTTKWRLETSICGFRSLPEEPIFYLASLTLQTLHLTVAADPIPPCYLSAKVALLQRMDARWRDFPSFIAEEFIDEATALRRLAERLEPLLGEGVLSSDPAHHERLRQVLLRYDSPLAYLRDLDDRCVEQDLIIRPEHRYSVAGAQDGAGTTLEGWLPPDDSGAWLVRGRATLRFYTTEIPSSFTLLFDAISKSVDFRCRVNGKLAGLLVNRQKDMTLLSIISPEKGGCKPDLRAFTIELFINDIGLVAEHGIKLRAFQLDSCSTAQPAKQEVVREFPDQLTAHNFVWPSTTDLAPVGEVSFPTDFLELAFKMDGFRRLDILTDASQATTPPPDAALVLSHTTITSAVPHMVIAGNKLPDFTDLAFDNIHFDHVYSADDLPTVLKWALLQISYRGFLSGREASSEAARNTVAALCRSDGLPELTFTLIDKHWIGLPAAYWRQ